MLSVINFNESVWSALFVRYNKRQNQRVEAQADHAISSSIDTTNLLLGHDILRKTNNNKREKCDFLKIIFFYGFFLTFKLGYCACT